MKTILLLLAGALVVCDTRAQEGAGELAARMNALQQDGSSVIRLKMDLPQGTLQVQIKQRRTAGVTEAVYQVLWPKERAGEAVLLKKSGKQGASGAVFAPPDTLRTLDAAQMKGTVFGSDLAYADVVENFFAWENQAIVGTENVGRTSCQILESKPGKGDRSIYSSVKTWVDTRRLVPMKVEKYVSGGQLARRIDTTRVVTQDGRALPANLTVHDVLKGTATELDGSNIKRGMSFEEGTFSPAGLKSGMAKPE
ncbi:outer membrane lipoprotein-sorting protein [Prosthecobacter sp.]|uniref:outer membrane lipoprotein-sorting protein n=1 Tax=Prosthecobacter sp. TaxID=1965333 RepID=UPI0037841F01